MRARSDSGSRPQARGCDTLGVCAGGSEGEAAAAAQRGFELGRDGDWKQAERELRRADALGSGMGARLLSVLLWRRGDLAEAEAAAGRAADRGDGRGANSLATIFRERGDFVAAHAADCRADELGSAVGAYNVACWLAQHGDWDGALRAQRRADERGSADGAFALGSILRRQGDLDGAMEAWRRGADRRHEKAAVNLAIALQQRGDVDGAMSVLRRADEQGGAEAAYELGCLFRSLDRRADGEAAFARAQQRGSASVDRLIERNRRRDEAERLVSSLPQDAGELTAEHADALSRLGTLMIENASVSRELAQQLETYQGLAVERGAPDDDGEHLVLAPYLSRQERELLVGSVERMLDAMNAKNTIRNWVRRSNAAPVLERLTGETFDEFVGDQPEHAHSELEQLRDELEQA